MNKQKLYIEINGPELSAMRYIYATQEIEGGIQFGAARNKHASNIIRILEEGDKFRIIFIRLIKPKYNHSTGTMTPHSKETKYEKGDLTIDELRTILNTSFK